MWTTYPDDGAAARAHDDEDRFLTLPLTDRHRGNPDLESTLLVDRRWTKSDMETTLLVNRPPSGYDDRTLLAPVPGQRGLYDPHGPHGPSYRTPVHLGGPGDPGDPYDERTTDPAPRRRPHTRRVLLAAGGLTLLGGVGFAAARSMNAGSAKHLTSAAAPQGRPASTPSNAPSSAASSAPTHAANPLPTGTPSSGNVPAQVQTAPEYYVHNGPKGIALTLDDGPTSEYTPQILALLQRYGITATFCMIGRQIPPNAALVREVAAAGHAIANHTWDHADQTQLTATQVRDSMARTSEALNDVGITPAIYRAPYGNWNANVFQACADARLRPLDWSVDPQDWARPGSATIVQRILKQTSTGSIILEHDGGGDRSQTVAALSVVLPELLNAGYRFGPI